MTLRVAIVVPELGNGGAERQAACLINALDPAEFEPSIAVFRQGGHYEATITPSLTVKPLSSPRIPAVTGQMVHAVPNLRRFYTHWRPDVVCSFNQPANLAVAASTVTMSNPPKIVLTAQTPTFVSQKTRPNWRSLLLRAQYWAYSRADLIITLSEGVRNELLDSLPNEPGQVRVIANGVVTDDMLNNPSPKASELNAITQRPVIVACGRLTPQKGFHVLLEAVQRLLEDIEADLWIIGEGPERSNLEQEAQRRSLMQYVHFLGHIDEPWSYMKNADVFAHAAFYEGFGNVLVEAMATGLPVVATDCPYGPREILGDQAYGLLVSPGSARELAASLFKLLTDYELRSHLSQVASIRANDFTTRASGERYAAEFRRLMTSSDRLGTD